MIKRAFLSLCLVGLALFGGTQFAFAQTTNNSNSGNFFQNLITAIAQKFGLDQNQVKSVVNQVQAQKKTQMQQIMQNRENSRLDNLVKQGKITSAQEQQIKDEIAKLQSEFPASSFKGQSASQRKTTMQNIQNEINAWSTSTGIDKKYLMPFGMMGMRGKIGAKRGWHAGPTPTPST